MTETGAGHAGDGSDTDRAGGTPSHGAGSRGDPSRATDTRGTRRLRTPYRSSGADLPFGHPEWSHGVAMEGYFWRLTDPAAGRVAIALIGVQSDDTGSWALGGLGTSEGSWRQTILPAALARRNGLGARAGRSFLGTDRRLLVDLGGDARLDVHLEATNRWPARRPFGGSSWFQTIPGLNQYWHPWLLGGRATGTLDIAGQRWDFESAEVYGEKNWGRAGFPDSWWWGQAQGFPDADACVAFAGGEVTAGPLRTEVTGLVVRLPDGRVIRLGNPVTSPVRADVGDEHWVLEGRSLSWAVSVEAHAPLADALVLPVPLVGQRRAVPGAIEQLTGTLAVQVRHHGHLVWEAESPLAGLEHGGLARAAALSASRA
ncbi:MAG: tocopherol cyclase family protein [Pauljensenia sp.]